MRVVTNTVPLIRILVSIEIASPETQSLLTMDVECYEKSD